MNTELRARLNAQIVEFDRNVLTIAFPYTSFELPAHPPFERQVAGSHSLDSGNADLTDLYTSAPPAQPPLQRQVAVNHTFVVMDPVILNELLTSS